MSCAFVLQLLVLETKTSGPGLVQLPAIKGELGWREAMVPHEVPALHLPDPAAAAPRAMFGGHSQLFILSNKRPPAGRDGPFVAALSVRTNGRPA